MKSSSAALIALSMFSILLSSILSLPNITLIVFKFVHFGKTSFVIGVELVIKTLIFQIYLFYGHPWKGQEHKVSFQEIWTRWNIKKKCLEIQNGYVLWGEIFAEIAL